MTFSGIAVEQRSKKTEALRSWKNGSSPVLFILIGIGLSVIASAFTSLMITFGDIYSVSDALVWLAGSVYGRTWEQVFSFLPSWLIVFGSSLLVMLKTSIN
jgi:iron complex transport system permease protein